MSEIQTNKPTFTQKREVKKIGNLTISEYTMTAPEYTNRKTGEIVPQKTVGLVELQTIKMKWSDELKANYEQKAFITITSDTMGQLVEFLTTKK